jgi:hypothetical protein
VLVKLFESNVMNIITIFIMWLNVMSRYDVLSNTTYDSHMQFRACMKFSIYAAFVLPPSQIIGLFGFSRYIAFAMHLDIHNVYLEKPKQPVFWNGGSRTVIISNYF